MDVIKVKWNKSAFKLFIQIVNWYFSNVGREASSNVTKDFYEVIHKLGQYPEMGMLDRRRSTSTKIYRSYLVHPKYRIIYRQMKTSIRIVDIICNKMEQSI